MKHWVSKDWLSERKVFEVMGISRTAYRLTEADCRQGVEGGLAGQIEEVTVLRLLAVPWITAGEWLVVKQS